MAALQRLADGTCRIWIVNTDGTPIDPARLSRISVLASSSAAPSVGDWAQLMGTCKAASGMLWIDDPDARNLPMRFYRACEKP